MTTIALTSCFYCAALHILKRARAYVPHGKTRKAIDAAVRVMGGGGSGPIRPS